MAKVKSISEAGQIIQQMKDSGVSLASIGRALNRDSSYVSQVARGIKPGSGLVSGLKAMAAGEKKVKEPERRATKEGGQAKVREPKGKPSRTPEEKRQTKMLDKAEKQISKMWKSGSSDKVVIHITSQETGRSITLGRKGGIKLSTIESAGDFGGFASAQAEAQGYSDDFDWTDVYSIEIEEYY